jgi:hypothetical protein
MKIKIMKRIKSKSQSKSRTNLPAARVILLI